MTTEIQAEIQAAAAIESMINPIDQLAVLNRQIKALEEQAKALKDTVANQYGEGKHRGEKYGVTISLIQSKTTDWKTLSADLGLTEETLNKYARFSASIRVTSTT